MSHCASRGKARSGRGTDIAIGGMYAPGDEQTISRIDGKYFQHCGRAGQLQLWLSRPSWRNIKSTWQEVSNFPWHQPPQNDSIVCTGAAPGWEPRGACQNWGEYPPGTGTLQPATPRGGSFKPLWVVAMFSLLSPCWQKPLGARDHSLVTLQPASRFLLWGKGGKEEKLVIVTSRLLPPKMLLPKGCPSGGGCWGRWLCPLRRTGHTDAVETGLGGSSYLWNAHGKCKHGAVSRALSRLFYLWITLPSPESVWVRVREININVAVVILISQFVLILSILWK